MTVSKIKKEYMVNIIQKSLLVFQRENHKELCEKLYALEEAVHQTGDQDCFLITADEDEVDLLVPYLRMLTRDHAMLSLALLGGKLPIASIESLMPLSYSSVQCVLAPLLEGRDPICVLVLPMQQRFQKLLALDAVVASVFTNRR